MQINCSWVGRVYPKTWDGAGVCLPAKALFEHPQRGLRLAEVRASQMSLTALQFEVGMWTLRSWTLRCEHQAIAVLLCSTHVFWIVPLLSFSDTQTATFWMPRCQLRADASEFVPGIDWPTTNCWAWLHAEVAKLDIHSQMPLIDTYWYLLYVYSICDMWQIIMSYHHHGSIDHIESNEDVAGTLTYLTTTTCFQVALEPEGRCLKIQMETR